MHVINSIESVQVPASETANARLVWIGEDDRDSEAVIVIHVMPTNVRR